MNEIVVNEHILKLTGKVSLPRPLTLGKTYKAQIEGDVTESRDIDKQDGTFDREFKFEPILVEILNDLGQSMKTKGKSKVSQKIRARQWVWQQENQGMDYEEFGQRLINRFDEVMEILK